MAVKIGALFGTVSLDTKQLDKDIKKVSAKLKSLGAGMKSVGSAMTRSITAPAIAVGAASLKVFSDFEHEMNKVKAVSGATEHDFDRLTKSAKALGASTIFTSREVAGLQLNLSKLGFTPDEILNSTESILGLAQATDSELGEAARVVAGTMRGFGVDTKDVGRITDVMAKAFSSSALDLEKFDVSMRTIAPLAKEFGLSFEETVAMIGILANNSVDASTAGTSLRNILLKLSKKGLSFGEAMNMIAESTNRLVTAQELFQARGSLTGTVLATQSENLTLLTDALKGSEGALQAMIDIMNSDTFTAMKIFASRIEAVALLIGEILAPHFEKLLDFVATMAEKFTTLDPQLQKNILMWTGIVAVVGPLLIAFGTFISLLALAIPAVVSLVTAVGSLIAAYGGVVAGVAAVIAALILLYDDCVALGEYLGETFYNAWVKVGDFFADGFVSAMRKTYDFIKQYMISSIRELYAQVNSLWDWFMEVSSSIGGAMGNMAGAMFGGFRAEGGPVTGGSSYIVGENGPELFSPSRSGYITSNEEMSGQNITMNFAAGTDMSTVAMLKNMKGQIAKIAVDAVSDDYLRGGLTYKSIS
jgi:phage-related minor tail protein